MVFNPSDMPRILDLWRRAKQKTQSKYNQVTGSHTGELLSIDKLVGEGTDVIPLDKNVVRVTPDTKQRGILFNEFVETTNPSIRPASFYKTSTGDTRVTDQNIIDAGNLGEITITAPLAHHINARERKRGYVADWATRKDITLDGKSTVLYNGKAIPAKTIYSNTIAGRRWRDWLRSLEGGQEALDKAFALLTDSEKTRAMRHGLVSDKAMAGNMQASVTNTMHRTATNVFPELNNLLLTTTKNYIESLKTPGEVWNKAKEYFWSESYDPEQYTFSEAYKDARSKGLKTFVYGGKYYNTDYEGEHGKLYKEDVKSGKAFRFASDYPNYTNPELRKEKLEELDTYGITNELTKNKTWLDKQLIQIPARGYNVSDAISTLLGEPNQLTHFNSIEEVKKAYLKKYPIIKDANFHDSHYFGIELLNKDGRDFTGYDIPGYELMSDKEKEKIDLLIEAAKAELRLHNISKENAQDIGNEQELHRKEYNMLLGYPMHKSDSGMTPIISKYKTGFLPYYYTTNTLEQSSLYGNILRTLEKSGIKIKHLGKYDVNDQNNPTQRLVDFFYSDSDKAIDLKKRLGITTDRGSVYIYNPLKFEWNATKDDIKFLNNLYFFDNIDPSESITNGFNEYNDATGKSFADYLLETKDPGNYLVNGLNTRYYQYGINSGYGSKGKYDYYINLFVNHFVDLSKNSNILIPEIDTYESSPYIYADELGSYTLSIPKTKDFISVHDKFDINPFGLGDSKVPIIGTIGKPYEYYTRFYDIGKEPDIDALYAAYKLGGKLNYLNLF